MSAIKSLFLQFHQPISIYVTSSQGLILICCRKKVKFCGIFFFFFLPKNHLFLQEFRGNFWANFAEKISVKKPPILWEFSGQISLEIDQFCTNFVSVFSVF